MKYKVYTDRLLSNNDIYIGEIKLRGLTSSREGTTDSFHTLKINVNYKGQLYSDGKIYRLIPSRNDHNSIETTSNNTEELFYNMKKEEFENKYFFFLNYSNSVDTYLPVRLEKC